MKELIYMPSTVGKNPDNPLCDLNNDDQAWLYAELVRAMAVFAYHNQQKDEVWDELVARKPKRFSKGKNGPNSVFSIVAGILGNYAENALRYDGIYRISKSQLEDLETAFLCLHAIDASFDTIRFKLSLFEVQD